MSTITRAFTTRRFKQSFGSGNADGAPQRSGTTKAHPSIRDKISAPVQLVHTTNMLTYNAPDLFPKKATSSSSSTKSDDELSELSRSAASSPPTSPDSPVAPKRATSTEPNHLSQYFTGPGLPVAPVTKPEIPKRAPSHTSKPSRSHDSLNRQRSVSRLSEQSQETLSSKASFSFSRSSSGSTSTSGTSQSTAAPAVLASKPPSVSIVPPPRPPLRAAQSQPHLQQHKKEYSLSQHPFGHELAQVSEIAEEFGVQDKLHFVDAEERELRELGLCKFSAQDYLGEVQGIYDSIFGPAPRPQKAAATESQWI